MKLHKIHSFEQTISLHLLFNVALEPFEDHYIGIVCNSRKTSKAKLRS